MVVFILNAGGYLWVPKCLFHVTSIGVTSCSWNLVFAIFCVFVFCSEMFGGGFEIVREG